MQVESSQSLPALESAAERHGAPAESLKALMRPANAHIARIVPIPFVGSWLFCCFDIDDQLVVSPRPLLPRRPLRSRLPRQRRFTDFVTSLCKRPIDASPSVV